MVGLYNANLSEALDRLATLLPQDETENPKEPFSLDLSHLETLTGKATAPQISYLVDMAKVEALDTLGDNRKAVELLDQHV